MTERDRRALLLGGASVLGAVLLLRVVPSALRWVLASERALAQRIQMLEHERADLAQAGALGDSAAQLTRALAGLAPKLLVGDTRAEAGADFASRLSLVAARHQVKIERVDQLADSAAAGRLRRTGVRIALESDVRYRRTAAGALERRCGAVGRGAPPGRAGPGWCRCGA